MGVDGSDGENGIFADVGMAMLEAGSGWRKQRFNEFGLAKFAEETEGIATNVFVRMLEVHSNAIAANSQYHFCSYKSECSTYHTRIISCFSFPLASSFGQIS